MEEDQLKQVFEPFYRAPDSSNQVGTGIGLALVKEIVELHHGQIDASSVAGISTTFTVSLPAIPPEAVPADSEGDYDLTKALEVSELLHPAGDGVAAEPVAAETRPTVLLADDDPELRAYVRRRLEGSYNVVDASDGREAYEAARRVLPDIVISDVLMPHMDGHELTATLKSDPDLDYVPVLLLTGLTDREARVAGLETGADAYLAKPFDARELRLVVGNLLSRYDRLQRHFSAKPFEIRASEIEIVPADQAFLESMRDAIEAHLADPDFGVEELASLLGRSRSTLHRQLKDLVGASPSAIIRQIRIDRARQLLEQRAASISEVAYSVGFQSVSYFAKCFRDAFGDSPSQYVAKAVSASEESTIGGQ